MSENTNLKIRPYIKTCALSLVILFTILINKSFAQTKLLQADWKTFIPKGYDTLATANGDLNKDGQEDKVLVLYNLIEKKEDNFDDIDRKLIILFKYGTTWKKVAETTKAVLPKNSGGAFGDPFEGISIKKNSLIIKHYGGSADRWSYTHRFQFRNNDFYLIGRTSLNYYDGEMCEKLHDFLATEYKDENFLTGQYVYQKMDDKECKWLKKEKGKHSVRPLQKLTAFNIDN